MQQSSDCITMEGMAHRMENVPSVAAQQLLWAYFLNRNFAFEVDAGISLLVLSLGFHLSGLSAQPLEQMKTFSNILFPFTDS